MADVTGQFREVAELLSQRKHQSGQHDQKAHTPKKYGVAEPKGLAQRGGTEPSRTYEAAAYKAESIEKSWHASGIRAKEAAKIIDKDGDIAWESDETEEFSDMVYIPDGIDVKGKVFTHYHPPVQYDDGKHDGHPNGVSQPLSPTDVRWASQSGMREMRSTGLYKGTKMTHRAYYKGRGWPSKLNYWLREDTFVSHIESYRAKADSTSDKDISALSYEAIHDYWTTVSRSVDNFEYEAYEPF